MKIIRYSELINSIDFFNFLKVESLETSQPASINLWSEDLKSNNHTLSYILTNTTRFNGVNGEFYILYDNDKIVACGGVYISEFSKDIVIAGVRTWVTNEYRHLALNKDYLLVEQKKWAISRNAKIIALSFNEYNKNIIQIFKRTRLGENSRRINSRESKHIFYNGLQEVKFPVIIQHTPQWVIYERLDSAFNFNWDTIQFKY
jgi:hypothetical protein